MTGVDDTRAQSKYRRSPGERTHTGQPIELVLQSGGYGGRMVARQDGRVVFVQGGVPGETVRAELVVEKRAFAEARAVAVLTPSERRVAPPCIYFGENGSQRGAVPTGNDAPGARGACGGCQYQHLSYDAQLDLKTRIVADLIHRQACLPDMEVQPAVPSPAPWRYRNRARWIVNEDGLPCYHQAASDRLLPVRLCHIVQPLIGDVLGDLGEATWRLPLRTLVAEITARTAVPWTEGNAEQPTPSSAGIATPRSPASRRRSRRVAPGRGCSASSNDGAVCSASPSVQGTAVRAVISATSVRKGRRQAASPRWPRTSSMRGWTMWQRRTGSRRSLAAWW